MSEVANEHRGEVTLALEGVDYVMRPSHAAITAFEAATRKSLIELAIAADRGTLSLGDASAVATECIRAWGKSTGNSDVERVNARRVGELILEYGLMRTLPRLAIVLTNAASGGCTSLGEPKPATKSPEAVAGE